MLTSIICKKLWSGEKGAKTAEAILYSENGIIAVGSAEEIRACPGYEASRKIISDGVIIPALSDSHIHLLAYAKQKNSIDLSKLKSKAEMMELLKARAAELEPGAWVCGHNLNESCWSEPVMPDRHDLDGSGIKNPILLHRVCTHATMLNSRALALSGLDKKTNEQGILRDSSGEPTGIIVEDAQTYAHSKMAEETFNRKTLLNLIKGALKECSSYGFSTLYINGADSLGMIEYMDIYQELFEKGELGMRIFAYYDLPTSPRITTGFGDRWINYQGYKFFLDGSLGARTAALTRPYSDAPETSGMYIHEVGELAESLKMLDDISCQSLVHTIGDAALDQLIDALEIARKDRSPEFLAGLPSLVVNHCMICRPEQIERMKKLRLAATIQSTYVISDRQMAPLRLSDRIEKGWAYRCKSLLDAGIIVNGSSDAPIETLNPWDGIFRAVTRYSGQDIWMPHEKVSVEEALSLYTANPAISQGAIDWRGTLTPGKEADFAVLDRDIFDMDEHDLEKVKVTATVVGGMVTHGHLN